MAADIKITTLDRRTLDIVRKAMDIALAGAGKEFGLKFATGSCSYDRSGNFATFKVEVAVVQADGKVVDKSASDFNAYCTLYGMKPEHLGAQFVSNGERFEISGLAGGRSTKYPILAKRVRDGKTFKFGQNIVTKLAGNAPAPTANVNAPATAAERIQVEEKIATMRSENPEGYYADGEFKAAGMSDKAIHDHHFALILKQIRTGNKPLMQLFQTAK